MNSCAKSWYILRPTVNTIPFQLIVHGVWRATPVIACRRCSRAIFDCDGHQNCSFFLTRIRLNQLRSDKNRLNEVFRNTCNIQITVVGDAWLNSWLKWYSIIKYSAFGYGATTIYVWSVNRHAVRLQHKTPTLTLRVLFAVFTFRVPHHHHGTPNFLAACFYTYHPLSCFGLYLFCPLGDRGKSWFCSWQCSPCNNTHGCTLSHFDGMQYAMHYSALCLT